MKTRGQFTFAEIMGQSDAWADALKRFSGVRPALLDFWTALNPRQVIFTGCGSPYYLSLAAASLFQGLTGRPARGAPASEIVLFAPHVVADPEHTLLVAISRSGTTTETVAAMARFRQCHGRAIVGVTCYPDTPVAQESDFVLVAESAQERSVAQTRSFSTMLVLVQALAAAVAQADLSWTAALPAVGGQLLHETAEMASRLGKGMELNRFFFLGSGPLYGIACEAMLKMKEMSLSSSEAFHFLEFRHGPKSMVEPGSLVVGLLSREAFPQERKVLDEVRSLGATTLALAPVGMEAGGAYALSIPRLPDHATPALYLPPLQLLAYHRSLAKGLDPDNPRNLEPVVHLDAAAFTSHLSTEDHP